MGKKETVELTCMCMVYDGDRILVQDRAKKDWPGINFPGGHVEPGESFVKCAIREVKEETGLDVWDVRLCGVKQWAAQEGSYRYIVLFFKTDKFSGQPHASEEGKVFWIDKKDLGQYELADGFGEMFKVFDNDALSENYHWYEDGEWRSENL